MPGDIVDVLLVHADVLQSRADQVEALWRAWQRGLQALQREPELSARALSVGVDLSPTEYLATLKGLTFYSAEESVRLLSGQPRELGQRAERLALTLQLTGLLRDTPDWGTLLDVGWATRLRSAMELQP